MKRAMILLAVILALGAVAFGAFTNSYSGSGWSSEKTHPDYVHSFVRSWIVEGEGKINTCTDLLGSSLTDHSVLVGSGSSTITALTAATNGQLLIGQTGSDPNFKTVTGDVTITAAGATTLDVTTIQYASVDVNEAELEALNTTPMELVAAPGTGKAVEFISAAIFYDHSTADYTTQGDLTIVSGTTGTAYSDTIAGADMVLGSADAYRVVQALSADVQLDLNESVVIQVDNADPTDPGTAAGALTVKVAYRIHDFN